MISRVELRKIARARLKDAQVLLNSGRFDGSVYLCGYVIEIGLKVKICKTLKWQEFPESRSEFKNFRSFKTHDLDVLLQLSGIEDKIKTRYFTEWSAVSQWNPESRYQPPGGNTRSDAQLMYSSAATILRIL